ncbi:DUF72 domain-containing protein [Georgenia sp. TF02-10]|uniref:DUF72 domain-containing protein n=1 Tax=Georgenia sp. TF02-10 TaxID=2917725 RepID=UPI001FA7A3F2|nr:DUF72 domain-containing protein [Georgenia sp. TF02-10]UNX55820.1 DUF72 domain-containing protein [Georgenia sp. TF02-10]
MAGVHIGISGWRYPPWRGVFYPRGLPQRRELEYVAGRLSTVEINGSFYSLQRPESYRAWYAQTPPGFVFAVKGGRFITHMKKLRDIETALANFFASGVLALADKLGPVLWQLPPVLAFDHDRLAAFLAQLPRTTLAAADVAAGHDQRVKEPAWTSTDADRPVRHAVEVRHESYRDPAFAELLRAHDVAVVVADTAGRWPVLEEPTTDLVYVRLHGDEELYTSGYTDAALDRWAQKIRAWHAEDREVYVYFDNDVKVRAPFDALALAGRLADIAAVPGSATAGGPEAEAGFVAGAASAAAPGTAATAGPEAPAAGTEVR